MIFTITIVWNCLPAIVIITPLYAIKAPEKVMEDAKGSKVNE